MGLSRVALMVLLVLQVGIHVDSAPIVPGKSAPGIKRTNANREWGFTATSLSESSVGTLTVSSTPTGSSPPTLLGDKYRPPIINFRYQGGPVSSVTISIPQCVKSC